MKKQYLISIMKLWTPLFLTCFCLLLLSVLGDLQGSAPSRRKWLIQECWGEPKTRDCLRKCTRNYKCFHAEFTCCWSYCGDICWRTPDEVP
ncbi:protein WFDC11 [Ochotona princeps]|uniref:protein WFDC11 n=1 Tax=Ochotona princeps TaxID=9978 RepID=UPI002714EEA7|nr:protein WFDC11 [Ochotona princeps]